MIQSRSQKSTTRNFRARAQVNVLVAHGPHDMKLRETAQQYHYELRRVTPESRNKTATYELTILSDDELVDKHVFKGTRYVDAVCQSIATFVKAVNDYQSS